MDNFVVAMSRYKRRRYDEAIQLCDQMLSQNELDQSAWILKCSCLTRKQFLDDLELDEEGIGDMLLDENSINTVARPGTSFQRPQTNQNNGVRPMTNSGRLATGYARPSTNRPQTKDQNGSQVLKTARQGQRLGTSRPMTQGGRYIRLGTASLLAMGGSFIQVDKLDLKKLAKKPVISRILCDYLIYVEQNPKKALELAAEATQLYNYNEWWWKERLGKCYFMLGMFRDAEKQFQSSLKNQEMIKTLLQMARVYIRFDQPNSAIEIYKKGQQKFPYEVSFVIGMARVYDLLNEPSKAIDFYRQTLSYESLNLESVASIAAYHFYIDQPEVSLKFYKRLIELGIQTSEIWNNLGLCCFFDGQYDLFYSCFEKALVLADNTNRADIWYNLSHIFINLGDLGTAYQCLKLTVCIDAQHSEAYNNLAILESKRGEIDRAKINYQSSIQYGNHLYEPAYNSALLAFKQQEYQQCYQLVQKALQLYDSHFESLELKKQVEKILTQI